MLTDVGAFRRLGGLWSWLVGLTVLATAGAMIVRESHLGLILLLLGVGFFVTLMVIDSRHPRSQTKVVMVASVVLIVIAVLVPPKTSSDVWSYAMYGRIAEDHGQSPYVAAPAAFKLDAFNHLVPPIWQRSLSVYGPLFTGMSAAVMEMAGNSPVAARILFQSIAGLAVLLALFVLFRERVDPRAIAILGLNPFVVVSVVNGGHNDALCGLALLMAALFATKGRHAFSGASLAAGALIKLTLILPGLALVLWILMNKGRRSALRFTAAVGLITAGGYGLGGGISAFNGLRKASGRLSYLSMWSGISRWLRIHTLWTSVSKVVLVKLTPTFALLGVVLVAVLVLLLVTALAKTPHPSFPMAATVIAYVVAAAYIEPWYLMWALPLVAMNPRSKIASATIGYSLLLLVASLPLAYRANTIFSTPLLDILPLLQLSLLCGLSFLAVRKMLADPSSDLEKIDGLFVAR